MEANDLRIGNLIAPNEDSSVVHIASTYHMDYARLFQGIPLTEDWLLKLGFESPSDGPEKEDEKNGLFCLQLFINKMEGGIGFYSASDDSYSNVYVYTFINANHEDQVPLTDNVKYVHQLQNLYFALTGKELEYTFD